MALVDLNDVWFEVVCSLVLLCVACARYFRPGFFGGREPRVQKVEKQLHSSSVTNQGAYGNNKKSADFGDAAETGTPEAKQAKRRIQGLFHRANAGAPNALQAYERMVEDMGMNFREHITDDKHAQALYLALIMAAVDSNKEACVAKMFDDMKRMGVPLDLSFFASLMRSLASRGKSQEVVSMYDRMVKAKVEPDSVMYICLMNDAIGNNRHTKAASFFEALCKQETPALRTFMTAVRVYDKLGDWRAARDVLGRLREAGRQPDTLILNTVLSTLVRAEQVDAAVHVLSDWRTGARPIPDAISYNTCLKGYAKIADQEKAEILLRKMLQGGGPAPTLITWNTMMDCAVRRAHSESQQRQKLSSTGLRQRRGGGRAGAENPLPNPPDQPGGTSHLKSIWDYLDEMEATGLTPDRYTCSTLVKGMSASCGAGPASSAQLDRAISALRALGPLLGGERNAENERLYEVLFNSLLDACVNAGEMERMAAAFAAMRDAQVPISAVTFGTLIKAFGNAPRLERCHECWAEMKRAKVKPTVVTFGCYVDSCVKGGELDRAIEVVNKEMPAAGLQPNTVIYTMLLKGCSRMRESARGVALYKEMGARGVERSTVTFNLIAEIVSRMVPERVDLVYEVLDDMRKAGVAPGEVTYSILLKGLAAQDQARTLDISMSLFNDAREAGLALDEVCYNTLVKTLCKANRPQQAASVYRQMRAAKASLHSVNYSVLVKAFGQANDLEAAFRLLEDMRADGAARPNVYTYTCLAHACFANGKAHMALEVFQQLKKEGLAADSIAYGTLINGMLHAGRLDDALDLATDAITASKTVQGEGGGLANLERSLKALSAALNRQGDAKKVKGLEALIRQSKTAAVAAA